MNTPKLPNVYLFLDCSNLFIPAREAARNFEPDLASRGGVRLSYQSLVRLAAAGRSVRSAYAVASGGPSMGPVLDHLRGLDVEVEHFERGRSSGREQAVDQALQIRMLRALADEEEPQIAVLLTGDGAGFEEGVGFHADLQRMHRRGWGIEVLSWDSACARQLRSWAEEVGVYISLDSYYKAITFVEGLRRPGKLSLTKRAMAAPGVAPTRGFRIGR